MKKGLGREVALFIIFALIVAGVLAILWIATELNWVLAWFSDNWLPFVVGYVTAMMMKLIATAISREKKSEHEK